MDAKALAGALAVDEDDEIMMLTKKGQAIRCPVLNIRATNRGTKGVKLVDLAKGDKLVAISRVVKMQEDEIGEDESQQSNEDDQALDQENPRDTSEGLEENPEESTATEPAPEDEALDDSSEESVPQEDAESEEPSKSDPPE